MKYLKNFNGVWFNESIINQPVEWYSINTRLVPYYTILPDQIINDLNDICLELEDIKYRIEIYKNCKIDNSTSSFIAIYPKMDWGDLWGNKLNYNEINETLDRIEDFADQNGYQSIIETNLRSCFIFFMKKNNLKQYKFGKVDRKKLNESIVKDTDMCFGTDTQIYTSNRHLFRSYVILPDYIIDDLNDICLELEDIKHEVYIFKDVKVTHDRFMSSTDIIRSSSISILHKNKKIDYSTMDEVLERIKDFSTQNGYDSVIEKLPSHCKIFFMKRNISIEDSPLDINDTLHWEYPISESVDMGDGPGMSTSNRDLMKFYCVLPNEMLNDLDDICLELRDLGFLILVFKKCKAYPYRNLATEKIPDEFYESTSLAILPRDADLYSGINSPLNCEEVNEILERIKDFSNQNGYDSIIEKTSNMYKVFFMRKKMNHLKRFESILPIKDLYEYSDRWIKLPNNIINEIYDICLELTDIGFEIDISSYDTDPTPILRQFSVLDIGKNRLGYFKYTEEISEIINRISDYLDNLGYDIHTNQSLDIGMRLNFINIFFIEKK